jgi:pimeloyl-ACP methyl ester carboxylesterase
VNFAYRAGDGDRLLGAVLRLPCDDMVIASADAGLAFVAFDLASGPLDEVALQRATLLAKATGVATVAIAESADDRLRSLGVEAVVPPDRIRLVCDPNEARRALQHGTSLVALDVAAAAETSLRAFAGLGADMAGPDPLVFVPGMLGDARVFEDLVAALPSVPCRPSRIDLDDSIAGMAVSVLATAPARFGLVGHSLGAIVAMEIWRRAPARVTTLVLLNASARPPSAAQLDTWTALRERTEAGDFASVVAEQAVINVGRHVADEQPALLERWIEMARRVGPEGFIRQLCAQATRPDSRPTLPTITVPTLVVSGADDAVCPPELQRELAAGIPGAVHVTVEGAGHMSPMDNPGQLATLLARAADTA